MNTSVEKFVAPVQELVALNVANIEKLAGIALESLEENVNAGIDTLKKAASVKDLDSARSYYTGQTEATRKVFESNVARSKTVTDIAQSYPASVKKIVDNALAIG